MKNTFNIPAIFLALLIGVASNGVFMYENICNITQTHHFSFFSTSACAMEKPVMSCCAKMGMAKKKGCCDHKQFFSKLSVEGFISHRVQIKTPETSFHFFSFNDFSKLNNVYQGSQFSGLPPPWYHYKIRSSLQPSPSQLQIFRC